MPRGSQGQNRPADEIGTAVMVARIAIGEINNEVKQPSGKVRSGIAGAKVRAKSSTLVQRHEIAKRAVAARWK